MKSETVDLTNVVDALEGFSRELSRLGERVAALEAAAAAPVPTAATVKKEAETKAPRLAPSPPPARPAVAEGLSEELILVIAAAIAAFVGKKAHIRQIRLIGSAAWAQQGRVTIQASHALSVHSARSEH
jgi:methylmalonyl-CoA carboxyltransferase large subunit